MRILALALVVGCYHPGPPAHGGHATALAPAPVDAATDADLAAKLPGAWRAEVELEPDGTTQKLHAAMTLTFGRADMQITYGDGSMMMCTARRDGRNLATECQFAKTWGGEGKVEPHAYRIDAVDQTRLSLFDYSSSATMQLRRQ